MLLIGGFGGDACESRQRLGGSTDPQHDAEKHRKHAEHFIVLVHVGKEVTPSIQVSELLHDPQSVRVVLHQVRGDRAEHREATGQTRREGECGRFVRLVGDRLVGEGVERQQRNARQRGAGGQRPLDDLLACAKLRQLLAQELIAVNPHTRESNNLLQKVESVLFRRRGLLSGNSTQLAVHSIVIYFAEHCAPSRLAAHRQLTDLYAHSSVGPASPLPRGRG